MSKRVGLKVGERNNIINKKLWTAFKKEHKIDIPYLDFIDVISKSNLKIKKRILDNTMGFKFPNDLGYIVVTRYKTTKRQIDHKKSKELNTTVYHTNFHSYGYCHKILWAMGLSRLANLDIYKFMPERDISRSLAKKIIEEKKIYNEHGLNFFKLKMINLDIERKLKGE